MALYEGLRSPQRLDEPAEPRWRRLQARTRAQAPTAPFLDRLLGDGSTQVLGRAVGTALAATRRRSTADSAGNAAPRRPSAEPYRARHMQAVGAGEGPLPRGRKGVIRGLALAGGLAWAAFMLKPWQHRGDLHIDVAALFQAPDPAVQAEEASAKASAKRQSDAADAAHLAALPLIAGGGKPLALWQDGRGRWYSVDAEGLLSPGSPPGTRASLGLVQVRDVAAGSEAHGQGRRLRLDLPDGMLKGLLPLLPAVASEAQALLLGDAQQPVILTYGGARCLLSREGWQQQEERLAMVLADLAAKHRRALEIDLRYEDSAVVKPAGR